MKEKNLKKMEKYPVFCSDSYTMLEKMDLFKSTFQTNTKMKKKNEIKIMEATFLLHFKCDSSFYSKIKEYEKIETLKKHDDEKNTKRNNGMDGISLENK